MTQQDIQEIAKIRDELEELRDDISAHFDEIESRLSAAGELDPAKLIDQLDDEGLKVSSLRRRSGAAIKKVEAAVQQSGSLLVTKSELVEFARTARQLRLAISLERCKGMVDPAGAIDDVDASSQCEPISVADARTAVKRGFQAAKELLALISGYSHYTPKQPPISPIAAPTVGQQISTWDQLEIRFTSEYMVQVFTNGAGGPALNYTEFGFEDRRNGKPTKAWHVLLLLAEKSGTIPPEHTHKWNIIEKRMQEIRKTLRKRFGLNTDPLLLSENGYQARFKITRTKSFQS